jgi:hypothetical protein
MRLTPEQSPHAHQIGQSGQTPPNGFNTRKTIPPTSEKAAYINAIMQKWLEQDIDNQLTDINWHYHHSPLLRKLLKAPELDAEEELNYARLFTANPCP